jgi:hypothetical protein
MIGMPTSIPGNSNEATSRVRRHRAIAGLIRVEVEVPTQEDALAVRRFAQALRRARDRTPPPRVEVSLAPTPGDLAAVLAEMDATQQAIALQFGHALAQTTDSDMLARGRRVALNFADAVARLRRDGALPDGNGTP